MSDAYHYLLEAIAICDDVGVATLLDGIPHCIISKIHYLARDVRNIPKVAGVSNGNSLKLGGGPDKLKRNKCDTCFFCEECGGVWRKYIDMYGWDEFNPVSKEVIS